MLQQATNYFLLGTTMLSRTPLRVLTLCLLLIGQPCLAGEYEAPNMFGDGGLLQPNLFQTGAVVFSMQQHTSKVCENNSVTPHDRISLGFNNLSEVRLGDRATVPVRRSVQEYRLCLEKTILQGGASLELLVPLLSTSRASIVGPDAFTRGPDIDTDIGNLAFGFKGLLFENCTTAVSAGLRIEAPTAPDTVVSIVPPDIDNEYDLETWYFTPWVGAQWRPGNGWFASSFLSYQMNSGPMDITTAVSGFAPQSTQVRQPSYLFADIAIGRWLFEQQGRCFSLRLAPTIELHYTSSVNGGEIRDGDAYRTGLVFGNTDYLNVTAGLNGVVNQDLAFGLGVAAPLRKTTFDGFGQFDTDRNYDWAFIANVTYLWR